jgi:DNA-binding transcriptional LysR family regulator
VTLLSQVLDTDAAERLRANDYDLALGVFFPLPDDIRRHTLLHEEFVCVLRRGHPALKRKLTVERYAGLDHVLISPRGGTRGVVDEYLGRAGVQRRVARTVASFYAAPHLVADSDYVLTVPERVARRVADSLDLVVRRPPVPLTGFDLELIWHRRNDDDPAHRWLRGQFAAAW